MWTNQFSTWAGPVNHNARYPYLNCIDGITSNSISPWAKLLVVGPRGKAPESSCVFQCRNSFQRKLSYIRLLRLRHYCKQKLLWRVCEKLLGLLTDHCLAHVMFICTFAHVSLLQLCYWDGCGKLCGKLTLSQKAIHLTIIIAYIFITKWPKSVYFLMTIQ